MIDYLENIETLSLKLMNKTASMPISSKPVFTIIKSEKTLKPIAKEECDIPFEKWIMPPQPEEYIKGRNFDPL